MIQQSDAWIIIYVKSGMNQDQKLSASCTKQWALVTSTQMQPKSPHITRFLSCDASDRIRYETTGNQEDRGIWLKSGPLLSNLSITRLISFLRLC